MPRLPTLFFTMCIAFGATQSFAAADCEIVSNAKGFVVLRDLPSNGGQALGDVPAGDHVSLFDADGDRVGAWVRVAYNRNQRAGWGSGAQGWVKRSELGQCG